MKTVLITGTSKCTGFQQYVDNKYQAGAMNNKILV